MPCTPHFYILNNESVVEKSGKRILRIHKILSNTSLFRPCLRNSDKGLSMAGNECFQIVRSVAAFGFSDTDERFLTGRHHF